MYAFRELSISIKDTWGKWSVKESKAEEVIENQRGK